MRKRITAALAALMVLISSAALAEDLSSLTDRELMKLYLDVVDEMRSRTAAEPEGTAVEWELNSIEEMNEADLNEVGHLFDFFRAWAKGNYDDMLEVCPPDWKAKQETPKQSLFVILKNQTPKTIRIEKIIGSPEDSVREVTITTLMDYNSGKEPVRIRLTVVMVREEGNWYVNPDSLVSYKEVENN